jgi:hypothetical protein
VFTVAYMTRRRAIGDLSLVLATGAGFLVLDVLLHRKALFIALAALGWASWIVARGRSSEERHAWGLRADNLALALRLNGWLVGLGAAVMIPTGLLLGRGPPSAGAIWLALFRRAPNVFAQGLSHGWLGAIAYHFILGHDPWRELMASLGH